MKFLDVELNAWAKAGSQDGLFQSVPSNEKLAGKDPKAFRSRKRKQVPQVVQLSLFTRQ